MKWTQNVWMDILAQLGHVRREKKETVKEELLYILDMNI